MKKKTVSIFGHSQPGFVWCGYDVRSWILLVDTTEDYLFAVCAVCNIVSDIHVIIITKNFIFIILKEKKIEKNATIERSNEGPKKLFLCILAETIIGDDWLMANHKYSVLGQNSKIKYEFNKYFFFFRILIQYAKQDFISSEV